MRLHPDFRYQIIFVGLEKTPVVIIDDFLNAPEQLIEFCVSQTAFSRVDNFYPGVRMAAPRPYIHSLYHLLSDLFAKAFGVEVRKLSGKSLYSLVVTPPEQLEIPQCLPHVDSFEPDDLACVHYLCGKGLGGTSLYRHKKTGFERISTDRLEQYNRAVISEGAANIPRKSYMNGSNGYFEQIVSVDASFNRLVIYPANILHSGNIAKDFDFNPDPSKGRLTLNSFLYSKRN